MAPPETRSTQSGWLRECVERMAVFWPAKLIGTTLAMNVFFIAYFWVLQHPRSEPALMPLTAADHWIAFRPALLPLYFSLWIYISLVPALLKARQELVDYVTETVALAVTGLGLFFIWPTMVPQRTTDWSQHPGFTFLQTIDASGNACPSLHVAFALFTAAWLDRILRQMGEGLLPRGCNWLWCAGILYSTVAVRQHVVLDVLAGMALGSVFIAISARRRKTSRCEEGH